MTELWSLTWTWYLPTPWISGTEISRLSISFWVASLIASAISPLVTDPNKTPSSPTCFLTVNLPIVFNFTANNANHTTSAGVSNFLSNFRVTTDGSTSISTVEDALLVTGNGGATSIWGWQNSAGNGTVEQTELVRLATLNSYDNDNMTASNIAFGNL